MAPPANEQARPHAALGVEKAVVNLSPRYALSPLSPYGPRLSRSPGPGTLVTLIKLVHQVDATCFKVIARANNLDVAAFL